MNDITAHKLLTPPQTKRLIERFSSFLFSFHNAQLLLSTSLRERLLKKVYPAVCPKEETRGRQPRSVGGGQGDLGVFDAIAVSATMITGRGCNASWGDGISGVSCPIGENAT